MPRKPAILSALTAITFVALLWLSALGGFLLATRAGTAASNTLRAAPQAVLREPPLAYACSAVERAAQVKAMRPDESSCYGAAFWPALFAAGLACRDVVAVSVGANKGYLLAHWADLLRPELNVTPASLYARFLAPPLRELIDFDVICGNCRDCDTAHVHTRVGPCAGTPGALQLWAVEPVPGNVALLRGGLAAAVTEARGVRAEVRVEQVALVGAPAPRTVAVEACSPGRETCGVVEEGAPAGGGGTAVEVPAYTLDGWAAAHGVRTIDVLAIDTEGLDAPVLAGGATLLARGGVRLLLFEYHDKRAWREATLQGVVAALDIYGFDCYLLQKKLALRLTGCWDPAFEFKSWSNVMCARRAEEALAAALAAFATALMP